MKVPPKKQLFVQPGIFLFIGRLKRINAPGIKYPEGWGALGSRGFPPAQIGNWPRSQPCVRATPSGSR